VKRSGRDVQDQRANEAGSERKDRERNRDPQHGEH
jgi:hypothetical protein